uniref:Uncharacterized protein n=1 Tax=Nelumbo nucifera TaxID=4432 RepID=A0A822Y7S3_NELNU|nr:TPA_asm: hypothetical protein HUJ06_028734 [Nelumbo nucifera]
MIWSSVPCFFPLNAAYHENSNLIFVERKKAVEEKTSMEHNIPEKAEPLDFEIDISKVRASLKLSNTKMPSTTIDDNRSKFDGSIVIYTVSLMVLVTDSGNSIIQISSSIGNIQYSISYWLRPDM